MKTTIEISDALLDEIRKLAAREGTTVRALVEQGLRHVVTERRRRAGAFRLRKASFKGAGLQPGVMATSWERIREMAYEARGG
jgi:Bacterial antitoxin of type II TA system, VapB